ncbi:MAG TPA: M23 family metallopeptidase, partial [Mycobacterium sp.]
YCARASKDTAHSGDDYPVAANAQVRAICDGDIIVARTAASTPDIWNRFTILRAENCGGYAVLYVYYGHVNATVGLGPVRRGAPIATVAYWPTGIGDNTHLHFGLRTAFEPSGWGYYPTGVSTTETCGSPTDPNAPDNVRAKALAAYGWIDAHSFATGYNWWSGSVAIGSCN